MLATSDKDNGGINSGGDDGDSADDHDDDDRVVLALTMIVGTGPSC